MYHISVFGISGGLVPTIVVGLVTVLSFFLVESRLAELTRKEFIQGGGCAI